MTTKTQKPQRKTASKSTKRGGCPTASSRNNRQATMTWKKVRQSIQREGCEGIFVDALEMAAEHLHRLGIKPTDLHDSESGELTEKGFDQLNEVASEAWQENLDNNLVFDSCQSSELLVTVMSDQAVLDLLLREAAIRLENRRLWEEAHAKPAAAATASTSK